MESDPGPEECPVAQQKSDVSGAAMAAGEALMTWLTYREKGALRVLPWRTRQGPVRLLETHSRSPRLRCLLRCQHWAPIAIQASLHLHRVRKCQVTCWGAQSVKYWSHKENPGLIPTMHV